MLSNARTATAIAFSSIAAATAAALRYRAVQRGARAAAGAGTGAGAGAGSRGCATKAIPPAARKCDGKVTFGVFEGQDRGEGAMDPPIVHDDPYHWLRDEARTSEEVLGHLKAENAYTATSMAHLKALQEDLFNEQRSHIQETDTSAPYRSGSFEYYTRTEEGKSYTVYCRRPVGSDVEQVLVDGNKEAEGQAHCDIMNVQPSPDHTILAYAVDTTGDEKYTIKFVDLATGAMLEDQLTNHSGGFCWGKDSSELYYLTLDDAHRPDKAWRHVLGTSQVDDVKILEERNELFWMGLYKTNSDRFVVLSLDSETTSEAHVVDLTAGDTPTATVIQPRVDELMYQVDHHGDNFLIVNNGDAAKEFKLSITPVAWPGKASWQDVMPYDPATRIAGVEVFKSFVVVTGRQNGLTRVWTMHMQQDGQPDAATRRLVEFDEELMEVDVSSKNMVYDADVVRLEYSSMTRPPSVADYNPTTRELKLIKQSPCPNYDPSAYRSRRIMVKVRDGTEVPVSLVYRKDAWPDDGSAPAKPLPLHLYGYGSYGICIEPSFSTARLCFLDRGMVYAIAHIRGGGEMGRSWYEDHGKFLTKMNTFTDFVDCAQHLVDSGITAPDRMSTEGRSAGGLLMGAVLNMAPQLFKAAVAGVPFVDVMNTMCDPTLPLTVTEWLEWGNPNVKKWYDYMIQYSPYDNVGAKAYPAMLVTAGLHDHRVSYWEPAKWVAKLREMKTDHNPILFKVDLSSGHFSASDRYRYMREKAVDVAFVLWQLGLAGKK